MSDVGESGPTAEAATAKAMVAGVFSDSAPSYDQIIEFFAPFGRALVAAADLPRGAKVLDVASGRGACLYPGLESVGPEGQVTGIDLAPGMIEALADDLARRGIENATVHVGDAEAIDVESGCFDAVTAGFMIFFCPDPDRVLAEFARVLKPGGVVALSTFDGTTPSAWLRQIGEELFGPSDDRPSEAFDRAEVLDAALVHAGFAPPVGTDVIERFHFDSVAQVEQWHRSHFARLLLSALDDDQLRLYRTRMAEFLEPDRLPDGRFEMVQRARMTVARKQ